ncbi:MAG: carboxypeptidase-like regulatory domain-containing protein, partial [Planctomycetota bacterium]|nr:carboxypeptidase-like regulatory domain-containing protein [Planctomycetota bacterium]
RWPCITGRVSVPGGGAAPPGTRIKALPSNARGGFLDRPWSKGVEVDEDGRFRLCDMRPGVFKVRAQAPGWAPTSSDTVRVSLRGDSGGVSIVLAKGGELVVTVSTEGQPIVGAAVEVYDFAPRPAELWRTRASPLPPPSAWPLVTESTDDDGKIAVEHLAPGDYWCLVRAEALLPRVAGPYRVREGAQTPTGPIVLKSGGIIRGRITDAQGKGLGGVLVTLIGQGQITSPIQLETDEQGGFASPMLPSGSYRVTARVAMNTVKPTRSATEQVELEAGAVRKVELEL